jgi:hypothetical protein
VNNELDRMRKEAVAHGVTEGRTQVTQENPVRIAGVPFENRTGHLTDTSHKCYRLSQAAG